MMNKAEVEKVIEGLDPFEQKVAQLVVDPAFRIISETLLEHGYAADHVCHAYKLLQEREAKKK